MLLERDRELKLLAELQVAAESGGGKVVLVRGEAGVGKSALVGEFTKNVADECHILLGACDDLLTPQTFGPFWDVALDESSLKGPLERGDRRAVMEALLGLLSRSLRPTVLVIEDTQWADAATLDGIRYLGRRVAQTKGLLILTYRDSHVDYEHPLRHVIGELPPQNVARLHLDGLSARAVASMVAETGFDVDDVLALTAGNPLFVTEVVESGVGRVPASVQDSVLARAAKLSPEARRVLDTVSVIPGDSNRNLIEALLGSTEEEFSACARLGLLRVAADTVSFYHELSRRAVESALSLTDRRSLNQEILAELGERGDLSRLVHHAREAHDVESIIRLAPRAAREALAVESYREAAAHFRIIEPYLDQVGTAERAAIVSDWARSEAYLDNADALGILDRALDIHRASGDEVALARTLTFAARVNEVNARPDAADACAAEALAILQSYPLSIELAHTTSQLSWLSMMRSDLGSAIELADRAITLAEAAGEELAAIYALNNKGTAMYSAGDSDGFGYLEEARRRAEVGGYAFEETRALVNMASAVGIHREVERAVDLAARARDEAIRYEIRSLEGHAHAQYAEAMQLKGEWADAEDAANEAALATNQYTLTYADMVLGTLFAKQGRPDAAAVLDRNWERAAASREIQVLCPAAAAQAEYMWLTDEEDPGKLERFVAVLEEVSIGGRDPWRAGLLAFWLWKLGALPVSPRGIAKPYQQIMEGKPEEAASIFEAMGIPYERALALMQGDEKRQLQALVIFETLGAIPAATKLRKSLHLRGVVVPKSKGRKGSSHATGLTPRQTEVLQLLGEDLSNAQIADQLFLSQRTVEHHVAAVMSKLDASSRDEAVEKAADKGILVSPVR